MPKTETESQNILIGDVVDYMFHYRKIHKWTEELSRGKIKPPDDIMLLKVAQITRDTDFWAMNPALQREKLTCICPSTKERVVLVENGFFYPHRLSSLEDPEIDEVLQRFGVNIREKVPVGQLNTAMRFATVLMGIITEPHRLSPEAVVEVAKLHCVQRTIYDYPQLAGSPEENTFLLYAGMKIIAQRLDRGIIGKSSWIDEYILE